MKFISRVGFVLGICVAATLIARTGASGILQSLAQAKWWLPCLVPLHALPLLLDAAGWRTLLCAPWKLRPLFLIAAIREGINRLLPVANVGGEMVGVHLLVRQGVGQPTAVASVVVETLLTLVSQSMFALVGLACLSHIAGSMPLPFSIFLSIAVMVAVAAAALLVGHSPVFERAERAALNLLSNFFGDAIRFNGRVLDQAMHRILAARWRLAIAILWQLSGMLVGCTETWLVLRWLGHPVSGGAAIALESLVQAARSVFFVIPAGLGVQEAGLMVLGRFIGLDAQIAISLSLAKRLREVFFGLPALGVWQWLEVHSLPRRVQHRADI